MIYHPQAKEEVGEFTMGATHDQGEGHPQEREEQGWAAQEVDRQRRPDFGQV
jgi:hypothetical protein